jgi:hypothetical protein
MMPILQIYAILFVMYGLSMVKDIFTSRSDVKSRCLRVNYAPKVANAIMRFTHLAFLEICLCGMIALKALYQDTGPPRYFSAQMILCYNFMFIAALVFIFQVVLVMHKKLGVIDEHLGLVNPNYRTLFEGLNKRHG